MLEIKYKVKAAKLLALLLMQNLEKLKIKYQMLQD